MLRFIRNNYGLIMVLVVLVYKLYLINCFR